MISPQKLRVITNNAAAIKSVLAEIEKQALSAAQDGYSSTLYMPNVKLEVFNAVKEQLLAANFTVKTNEDRMMEISW